MRSPPRAKAVKDSKLRADVKEAMFEELEKMPGCDANLLLDFEDAVKDKVKGRGKSGSRVPTIYSLVNVLKEIRRKAKRWPKTE